MNIIGIRNILIIGFSFVIALLLSILPLPHWAIWWRPQWVLLVLIYWTIIFPYRINVGTAFILGLLLDALNGNILGENALALTLIIYLAAKMHHQLRVFPFWQQVLAIMGLVLSYQVLLFWIQGAVGQDPGTGMYWASTMTSVIFWPWVYRLLQDCNRRFLV